MLDLTIIKRIHEQTMEHGINPYFDPEKFARAIEHEAYRRAAAVADTTICATHLPTGVAIYGINAGRAIRALGITGGSDAE